DLADFETESCFAERFFDGQLAREITDVAAIGSARALRVFFGGFGKVHLVADNLLPQSAQLGPRLLALAFTGPGRNSENNVASPDGHAIEEIAVLFVITLDIRFREI